MIEPHALRRWTPASSPMFVERCPRLERVGRGLFEGEEAVLLVMGLPRWALGVRARSLRLASPRWWPGGRPVADRAKVRLSALEWRW